MTSYDRNDMCLISMMPTHVTTLCLDHILDIACNAVESLYRLLDTTYDVKLYLYHLLDNYIYTCTIYTILYILVHLGSSPWWPCIMLPYVVLISLTVINGDIINLHFLLYDHICYSTREGSGTPLQYSCLENPMGGRAWKAAVHGVAEGWTRLSDFTFMHRRRKWQPTSLFLPGESQGRGSLVGCRLWGRTESDTTQVT